jgi:MFS family permease
MIYGFFFMSSYPIVEAALMESVPDSVRGRVFGFFITIGGLVGSLSHWIIGGLVDGLGPKGRSPEAYFALYALLALLVVLSLGGLPCLHAIRKREKLELPAEPSRPGPAAGQPKSALQ